MIIAANRYVLFPIGKKRFALKADDVAELARPDRLQTFPHTTPMMAGVLVRRGLIIPVCDIAEALVGPKAPERRFYLIANQGKGAQRSPVAIPVTGECELVKLESRPQTGRLPRHVLALLAIGDEIIEVLNMDTLLAGAETTEASA